MSQDCKIRMLFCEILLGYYSSFKFNYIICNCTNTNLQRPTHRLKDVISLSLRHFFIPFLVAWDATIAFLVFFTICWLSAAYRVKNNLIKIIALTID
jgi:hypothetical protein